MRTTSTVVLVDGSSEVRITVYASNVYNEFDRSACSDYRGIRVIDSVALV